MVIKYFRNVSCIVFTALLSVVSGAVMDTIKGVVFDSLSGTPIDSVIVASEGAATITTTTGAFALPIPTTKVVQFQSPRCLPTLVWHPENGLFSWSGYTGTVSITVHALQGTIVARTISGKTAASSTFSIANLPQGTYAVTVAAQGHLAVYTVTNIKMHQVRSFSIISQSFLSGSSSNALATAKAHVLTFTKSNYDTLRLTVPAGTQAGLTVKLKSRLNFIMPKLNYVIYKPPFEPSTVPGIRPLFDGETLTGWNYDPKVWSVVNNYMKCTSDNTFAGTLENFSEFRLFVSSQQVSGQYGQTGYGFYGAQPPKGQWSGEAWKFIYLVGPTCIFWDYVNNNNDGTLNCAINMEKPPYNLPRQGKPGPWWQHEFLVSMSKGTIRGALNGVDFLNFKLASAAHKDRAAFTSTPIGFIGHYTNTEVRYKDVWIEVNPKQPDTLYSVIKKQ